MLFGLTVEGQCNDYMVANNKMELGTINIHQSYMTNKSFFTLLINN